MLCVSCVKKHYSEKGLHGPAGLTQRAKGTYGTKMVKKPRIKSRTLFALDPQTHSVGLML